MVIERGLSDFHKMTVTVMKQVFKKKEPIKIVYHDRSNFNAVRFREKIKRHIETRERIDLGPKKNMDLFPAHRPGKFFFHHQPAAKLNIFFLQPF